MMTDNSTGALAAQKHLTWRHKKSGTLYKILHFGTFQIQDSPHDDNAAIVYQSLDESKRIWVRPHSEFTDGRFEVVRD